MIKKGKYISDLHEKSACWQSKMALYNGNSGVREIEKSPVKRVQFEVLKSLYRKLSRDERFTLVEYFDYLVGTGMGAIGFI